MKDLLQGDKTINQLNHNPTLEDKQKEYKLTRKIGQFFEELKVQSRN
jgi:hypothetical protein